MVLLSDASDEFDTCGCDIECICIFECDCIECECEECVKEPMFYDAELWEQ